MDGKRISQAQDQLRRALMRDSTERLVPAHGTAMAFHGWDGLQRTVTGHYRSILNASRQLRPDAIPSSSPPILFNTIVQ
jgi:hypothetical protein